MTTFPLTESESATPVGDELADAGTGHSTTELLESCLAGIDGGRSQTVASATRQYRSGSYLGDLLLRLANDRNAFPATARSGHLRDAGTSDADSNPVPARETPEQHTAAPDNRRAFPRSASECVVSVHRCKPDAPVRWVEKDWLLHASRLHGQLRDISMSGVAFSMAEPIEPNEILMLRIANPQLGTSVDSLGRVVRVTHEADLMFVVFLRFDRKLAFDQISPLRLQFSAESVV